MRWQNAKVTRILRRSETVSSFFFQLPVPFAFAAGQHVIVRLTAPDGYRAQRSYSIASPPDNGPIIELAIERLNEGEVSPFFHDVVEVGDEIELGGPIGGHFVWNVADGGPVLLIGAGSGVAPLVSMIRYRARAGSDIPMMLLFSARTKQDFLFGDELSQLARSDDKFKLMLTLTRDPDPGSGVFSRRIDAEMISEAVDRIGANVSHAYVCGSNAFCDRASDSAIAAGVLRDVIRTERYGV
ncbi:MAG: ferredoxin reductase [Rhizobiaceae bacterium]|nr:ferredoxin reductase [Rhizobiaceae bacterium]